MKEKSRKVTKFSVGSKQMDQNRWLFEGGSLNRIFFRPRPPQKFPSFRRHWYEGCLVISVGSAAASNGKPIPTQKSFLSF